MTETVDIRDTLPTDHFSVTQLYSQIFPDEDLVPLVQDLLALGEPDVVSLVATNAGGGLVGHVAFTFCSVAGTTQPLALLAPLAVAPEHQRCGIGTPLVREGFERLRKTGVLMVFTLGDPAYYVRHGFRAETGVTPPYELPDEWRGAWQSAALCDGAPPMGAIRLPEVWLRPSLWLP